MLKKILLLGTVVLVVGGLLVGRKAVSYVNTGCGWVKDSVKDNVPIGFELERARQLVHELVPDIRKNMHLIAKEEVEVARLAKQIAQNQARQEKDKARVMRMKNDLATGANVFHYASRTYTVDEIKTDLAHSFERFKTNDITLESLKEMHRARERSLEAARQKLETMLASRTQLAVEIEQLEARLKSLEAAQASSDYNFDDSNLAQAKELIGELRTRLEVDEKLVNAEGYFHDEIPLDEPPAENIVEEVTAYFTPNAPQVAEVAADTSAR